MFPTSRQWISDEQTNTIFVTATVIVALAAFLFASPTLSDNFDLPREHVSLVAPPFVHPHEQATNEGPKIVEFTLVVEEKRVVIDDDGTTLQAMTFNGTIPGPMMVVHEDDYVERAIVMPPTHSAAMARARFLAACPIALQCLLKDIDHDPKHGFECLPDTDLLPQKFGRKCNAVLHGPRIDTRYPFEPRSILGGAYPENGRKAKQVDFAHLAGACRYRVGYQRYAHSGV